MPQLAINGGPKIRSKIFPASSPIGREEQAAAKRVIKSKVLSRFLGAWHEDFYGGPEVRALEKEWAKYYQVKHAITVNSATSGLYCAIGAIGTEPGDEIIVSPYSMSCSATAPLIYNAIPVFADIEENYFCLSPESIEKKITPRTKAIIAVDLFGQPYDADKINALAKKHGLMVIEDAAQAPGARYKDRFAGTLGNIGVYSLNYHKHIHTGEGGVVVTNDDDLADKIRLIRNHAEAVVERKGYSTLVNMLGFNYRMTEIEAAIGRTQLKKLKKRLAERVAHVDYLNEKLAAIPCLKPVPVRPNATHSYYIQTFRYDAKIAGLHRDKFVAAVKAELAVTELRETEGVKIGAGYVQPLYLEPLFQNKIAYGRQGCPWSCQFYSGSVDYGAGLCPVVEAMHQDILITTDLMYPEMSRRDLDDVIKAFYKVWENKNELI